MTEHRIQKIIANFAIAKSHTGIVPNCGVFGWEADLISINANGYACEYEIKISRSDFLSDAKKRKHRWIVKSREQYPGPSYFYYVIIAGLVREEEIPKHAGFLEVHDNEILTTQRRAPCLHRFKLTERQLAYIHRGIMLRYWKKIHKEE